MKKQFAYLTGITLLLLLLQTSAYTTTDGIETNDEVNMYYQLKYDNAVQQTNNDFTTLVSSSKLIQGFYEGLLGMKVGQEKEIVVTPDKGYPAGHELGGKFLYFTVKIYKITKNVRDGLEVTEVAIDLSTTDSSESLQGQGSSNNISFFSSFTESPIVRAIAGILLIAFIYMKFLVRPSA